jgi:hypothetical protein
VKTKCLLIACSFFLLIPSLVLARTWKDKTGRIIDGKFVRVTGDSVVILLRSNKPLMVPLDLLSDEDVEYVRSQSKKSNPKDDASPKKSENPFEETEQKSRTSAKTSQASSEKAAASGSENDSSERTWVDANGNQLVAKFEYVEGTMVALSKKGVIKKYPIIMFSVSDRQYIIREMQNNHGEANPADRPDNNSPANMASNASPPALPISAQQQNAFSRSQEIIQKMEADRAARQSQMDAEMERLRQQSQLASSVQPTANPQPMPNQPGQPPVAFQPMGGTPTPQYTEVRVMLCSKCQKGSSC